MRRYSFLTPFLPVLGFALASSFPDVSSTLQNILKNTDGSDRYTYPTDFTRGIIPKPIHSHNDYWRDVPFYTGLSYGAISTEADVWLINGTLYVGHEPSALTQSRTLSSLYITPILNTLTRQNPLTPFSPDRTQNGVFDTDATQTLYLFIDLKTPGPSTWSSVLAALEPLRAGNYLSSYDGTTFTTRAVTVIGTGNTPLYLVQSAVPRDAFFDAPLAELGSETYANVTANDAPVASTDFAASVGDVRKPELNEEQLKIVRAQIAVARERGIMARYWNQPQWPVGTRNAVWKTLWEEGVGLVNADDVGAAAGFWEGTGV